MQFFIWKPEGLSFVWIWPKEIVFNIIKISAYNDVDYSIIKKQEKMEYTEKLDNRGIIKYIVEWSLGGYTDFAVIGKIFAIYF